MTYLSLVAGLTAGLFFFLAALAHVRQIDHGYVFVSFCSGVLFAAIAVLLRFGV